MTKEQSFGIIGKNSMVIRPGRADDSHCWAKVLTTFGGGEKSGISVAVFATYCFLDVFNWDDMGPGVLTG
uniref:Uncharacterized protein n=1 Tax=Megaselia scalaris TaxID=36166 RepID=T1GCG2_MEGSC